MRCFTRLADAVSKKVENENYCHALALYVVPASDLARVARDGGSRFRIDCGR
jgi:hypothetical protein